MYPQFIHSFTYKGKFDCFQVLTIIRNLPWTSVWRFLTRFTFSFLWKGTKNIIGKSYAGCIPLRCLSLVSSVMKEIVKLYSHQQWIRVPLAPHPSQDEKGSVFLSLVILKKLEWYLELICISLKTYDIEHISMCLFSLVIVWTLVIFLIFICVFLCSDVRPF